MLFTRKFPGYKGLTRCLSLVLISFSCSQALAADPYITELYQDYCKACHTAQGSGAPLAFNPKQWKKVLSQGKDNVINNAILGKGNMPALGGCQECTYEDIDELVTYMSSVANKKNNKEQQK